MLLPSQFRIFPTHLCSILHIIRRPRRLPFQNHRSLAMVADNWQRVEKHETVPPYTFFTKSIDKSQLDDRDYRLIKLENDLLAMLVHDTKADIAAASLDVAVGHLSDPVSTFLFGAPKTSSRVLAIRRGQVLTRLVFGVMETEAFANCLRIHRMTSLVLLTSANTCYSWYEPFPVTSSS
jgi:hypothetical protein